MLARRARRAREITSLLARGARSDVFLANDASREASTSSRRSKPSNETKPSEAKRTLLREHLHDALYAPNKGYFTNDRKTSAPVGTMDEGAIDFKALRGQDDYFGELNRRYARLGAQWLTPGEIFAPHYADALVRYVLETHRGDYGDDEALEPLRVYEIGGGAGTFASGFLDAVKREAPKVYEKMRYTSIDISKRLCDDQLNRVRRSGHANDVHDATVGDATSLQTWGATNEETCFVIALEVLDNLPHDRVWRPKRGEGEWMQTEIVRNLTTGELAQREAPLADALIQRTLQAIDLTADLAVDGDGGAYNPRGFMHSIRRALTSLASSGDETWFVPTGSMQLMETLHAKRPNHRFIAADFDTLPNVRIEGVNAPLVATQRVGGQTDDHDTYLLPERLAGSADVFFPTCFDTLRAIDFATSSQNTHRANARLCTIVTTKKFMTDYADVAATVTGSGYNPLLQDFSNTKFLLSGAPAHPHDHDHDDH